MEQIIIKVIDNGPMISKAFGSAGPTRPNQIKKVWNWTQNEQDKQYSFGRKQKDSLSSEGYGHNKTLDGCRFSGGLGMGTHYSFIQDNVLLLIVSGTCVCSPKWRIFIFHWANRFPFIFLYMFMKYKAELCHFSHWAIDALKVAIAEAHYLVLSLGSNWLEKCWMSFLVVCIYVSMAKQ